MYLKSLVIKGFKTFAEKEELTFDSPCGITAIVGPNGCGKSNVVDSFRFGMGENNIRELRVHSVPEVIFAGTESKKPLSLAEVSLSFDNTNHKLPVDYSEVSVKRRTFRDGESEFLINNQVVRLKDIRDMFLDSGISTESLSIMSQGNVDSILSSKPEERRTVFEEVAGINKYKFRKLEAERKLILSEQNLLRISDLKVEVGEQLIALEAQAKAAREYKDIQDKLKIIELSVSKKQAKQLLEKRAVLLKELEIIKQQAQEKEEQRRRTQEEKIEKMRRGRELEELINAKLLEIGKVKEKIEEERGNILLEKERVLFEEKNKLRDLKEGERFLGFEIKKLKDNLASLNLKKEEIEAKSREMQSANLEEFHDFKDVVRLTVELSSILKEMLVSVFGKSWEELKDVSSVNRFKELLDAELIRIEDEAQGNRGDLEFKIKKDEELKAQIAGADSSLLALVQKTQDFEKAPSNQNIEQLLSEKLQKTSELDSLRDTRSKLLIELEALEGVVFEEGGANTTSDLLKNEVSLARIEQELAQIEMHAKDEYNMPFEELLAFEPQGEPIVATKKEIEASKARLRELEPVNLLAIEEYDKCKERHAFIDVQHQDIVLARENLKTLITELDLKAREDFIKCMEIVTKNFKEVFSELFEGGEADIIIEKDKDALEAGIDITVRPAQRKWLGLSLLSGGERALTAIALLFAILKTSPTPLCILDEVDAALDDANIGRFAAFLKKFSETTQIIVITHNKRTMAVADTIYGVTMEEPGVSRVISVRLEKAV